MEGENSGKKKSAEQVHLAMRKDFVVKDYVTVQQIKSLFSRMSAEQRKGSLSEPTKNSNKETEEEDEVIIGDDDQDIDPGALRKTAYSVMTELLVECDEWLMVLYDEEMFPGVVKNIDNRTVRVQCMEYEKNNNNHFRWPALDDITDYRYENIISSIDVPEIIGVSTKN